jgi:hypothetical protein
VPLRRTALKRGAKGLKRSAALVVDPGKVRDWVARTRTPLAPVAKQGARRGTKATETLTPEQEMLRGLFKIVTEPCRACGWGSKPWQRPDWVEAHHCLSQQAIRRLCRAARVNPHDWLWDARNRMPLCSFPAPCQCHDNHEAGGKYKLTHTLLDAETIEFVNELDDMLEAAGLHREANVTLAQEWS